MKNVIVLLCMIVAAGATADGGEAGTTGFHSEVIREIDFSAGRLIQLAEAVPADLYDWRPAEGVRTFREVFLHIADGNYFSPTFTGAEAPEWFGRGVLEARASSKEEVIEELRASFDYVRDVLRAIGEDRFDETVRWYGGSENTVRGVMLWIPKHIAEHQGQLIAYARMNGIVPPWSQ
jgi:uncharacterized damage-inducible protein DinB